MAHPPKGVKKKGQVPDAADIAGLSGTQIPVAPGPAGGLAAALPFLISIYKSKAAREAATAAFRNLPDTVPESLQIAANRFAAKYPRIAAHMRIRPEPIPNYKSTVSQGDPSAHIRTPPGKVQSPMEVEITQKHWYELSPISGHASQTMDRNALTTMFHEGAHAAQALGNSRFNQLYSNVNDLVGYEHNPFEVTAIDAGVRQGLGSGLPINMRGNYSPQEIEALNQMSYTRGLHLPEVPPTSSLSDQDLAKLRNLQTIANNLGEESGRVRRTAPRMIQDIIQAPKSILPNTNMTPIGTPGEAAIHAVRGGGSEQTAKAREAWFRLQRSVADRPLAAHATVPTGNLAKPPVEAPVGPTIGGRVTYMDRWNGSKVTRMIHNQQHLDEILARLKRDEIVLIKSHK